jgi:putative flippase GtrA
LCDRAVMTPRPARQEFAAVAATGVKFLLVGGFATVVTIGVFNLLVHVGSPPLLNDQPILAYGVALVVGLAVNYVGNRFWAFDSPPPGSLWRQMLAFLAVNAVAFAIPAVCLGVSRYLLGLDSALADNVSANVVGLVLATAARWWLYRRVVFVDLS